MLRFNATIGPTYGGLQLISLINVYLLHAYVNVDIGYTSYPPPRRGGVVIKNSYVYA